MIGDNILLNQLTYFVFRIKGTLSSHMEFYSYPMDVQTLRLQFAACVFIIGLHITINMNNVHFAFLAKKGS